MHLRGMHKEGKSFQGGAYGKVGGPRLSKEQLPRHTNSFNCMIGFVAMTSEPHCLENVIVLVTRGTCGNDRE